jgi:hypothetical protein
MWSEADDEGADMKELANMKIVNPLDSKEKGI